MLVETRHDDSTAAPYPATDADHGGAALRDLIAARLVSQEAIGDPDLLPGGEQAALAALCRQVAGPVYRIAPFHYAFAGAADIAAPLADELGSEALWISPLDHVAAPAPASEPPPRTRLDAPLDVLVAAAGPEALPAAGLLLLRARAEATAAGLAVAGPEVQAVIDARYAVDCARLSLEGAPGPDLARRLAAIEAGMEAVLEAGAAAREGLGAFEERLGSVLAEFLARLERRETEAGESQ